ncbi:MAG TPA: glycosyltransferase family 9 protein [Vicinamibacteria bacterium]|nr:glycosyltransferase family 9 protein [Vicinamibacteria bacterium]
MVLLRTAVAALRAAAHSVSLLAPSSAGAALRGHGRCEVDAVLPWESATFAGLLADGPTVSPALRDALAPFQGVIAYTTSADLLRGLHRAAPSAQIVSRPPLPPPGGPHAAEWLATAVSTLGRSPGDPPLFVASDAEDAEARPWHERLGPHFVAMHPGSGAPRKNWPAPRFAALAERLSGGEPFLLLEGPADAEAAGPAAGLESAVRARDLPPRVLGALLARAGLYVGNDSGVSHLAAAWGAPVLALFGPTDPAQWAPVGPRVRVLRAKDKKMESLELEDVERAARRILDATSTETDRHG